MQYFAERLMHAYKDPMLCNARDDFWTGTVATRRRWSSSCRRGGSRTSCTATTGRRRHWRGPTGENYHPYGLWKPKVISARNLDGMNLLVQSCPSERPAMPHLSALLTEMVQKHF